jgi:hypothetical protein
MTLETARPVANGGYYAHVHPALPQLRPYQVEAFNAIADSVLNRRGLTFTVVMARQSGKNELSAQLELFLLSKHMNVAVDAIKCAPTFIPQGYVSFRRLRDHIARAHLGELFVQEPGPALRCERARQLFLSANDSSNVSGHTAGLLLEVDEAQDVSPEKFDREFRPMAASTGATIVYYGTPWDDFSLLAQAVEHNRELERRDGLRRHFEVDWTVLAAIDPVYAHYVEGERERLGENHPLFRTQYALQTIAGGGRLFDGSQRAQLQGTHSRQSAAVAGETYVAGLDVGGQSFGEHGVGNRDHDATVLTIARVVPAAPGAVLQEPRLEVVEHIAFNGAPHDFVLARLVDLLGRVWRVRRVSIDATGLGETMARFLARALGEEAVRPVKFTAESKSRLGFGLLGAVNGGRLRMYASDGSEHFQTCRREIELARAAYRPNRTMNFFVDERDGRDDYLVSLALAVDAAQGFDERPRIARGHVRAGFGDLN